MFSATKIFPKMLLSAVIIALLIAAFGLPHFGMSMTMDMDENGNMSMDCYMPGMTAVCNMTPLEHVADWQSMFTSILSQNISILLLLAMLAAIVGFIWTRHTHSPPQKLHVSSRFIRREYIPHHTSLQELLSNGILHPKVF
jgi:hypothetical protein